MSIPYHLIIIKVEVCSPMYIKFSVSKTRTIHSTLFHHVAYNRHRCIHTRVHTHTPTYHHMYKSDIYINEIITYQIFGLPI